MALRVHLSPPLVLRVESPMRRSAGGRCHARGECQEAAPGRRVRLPSSEERSAGCGAEWRGVSSGGVEAPAGIGAGAYVSNGEAPTR
jgi:hypothetical protein